MSVCVCVCVCGTLRREEIHCNIVCNELHIVILLTVFYNSIFMTRLHIKNCLKCGFQAWETHE